MDIERTFIANQDFNAHIVPDIEGRDVSLHTRIVQSIESEEYYPRDPIAQEDFMERALDDLYDANHITEEEAVAIFGSWIRTRRPDVRVINLPRRIAEPFYE